MCSRALKRLDSAARGTLFASIAETASGLTTIRAFTYQGTLQVFGTRTHYLVLIFRMISLRSLFHELALTFSACFLFDSKPGNGCSMLDWQLDFG